MVLKQTEGAGASEKSSRQCRILDFFVYNRHHVSAGNQDWRNKFAIPDVKGLNKTLSQIVWNYMVVYKLRLGSTRKTWWWVSFHQRFLEKVLWRDWVGPQIVTGVLLGTAVSNELIDVKSNNSWSIRWLFLLWRIQCLGLIIRCPFRNSLRKLVSYALSMLL